MAHLRCGCASAEQDRATLAEAFGGLQYRTPRAERTAGVRGWSAGAPGGARIPLPGDTGRTFTALGALPARFAVSFRRVADQAEPVQYRQGPLDGEHARPGPDRRRAQLGLRAGVA